MVDNGKGITTSPKESSFGIKLIKALSKKLKADLRFNNNLPSGTKAILTMARYEKL